MVLRLIMGGLLGGITGFLFSYGLRKFIGQGYSCVCTSNPYTGTIVGIIMGIAIASGWGMK